MVGRGYCFQDSCTNVWVNKTTTQTQGSHIRWSRYFIPSSQPITDSNTQLVQATHYTIDDRTLDCAYYDKHSIVNALRRQAYELTINHSSNLVNPPSSYKNYINVDDLLPSGFEFTSAEGDGLGEVRIIEMVRDRNTLEWSEGSVLYQGRPDYVFVSVSVTEPGGYYDSNNDWNKYIYANGYIFNNCSLSSLFTNYFVGNPHRRLDVEKLDYLHDRYCYLTFHNYNGIPGATHTEKLPFRPGYLEIVNSEVVTTEQWEKYEIKKEAYTEKVEVVDFAYNFGFGGLLVAGEPTLDIPRNCLNIYKTKTNPNTNPFPIVPPIGSDTEFIAQFCTDDPGVHEPPEYYVICGCQPECPPGTCQIECDDHYCCYNSDGISILEIPK